MIAWRSKLQKVVSLSSAEAEFYACAEAVKEVPFIVQILRFLGVEVKTPVEVRVDNVGAIYMSQNQASSTRTRHMDTRWFYVNDLQDDGLIIVKFVRSEENISDVATKNVSAMINPNPGVPGVFTRTLLLTSSLNVLMIFLIMCGCPIHALDLSSFS